MASGDNFYFLLAILLLFVNGGLGLQFLSATDSEIQDVIAKMLAADVHRPRSVHPYWQGHTNRADTKDHAELPLFQYVPSSTSPFSQQVSRALHVLYNQYSPDVNSPEIDPNRNAQKREVIGQFLDSVIASPVIRELAVWLSGTKHYMAAKDKSTFKNDLYMLWFQPFSRHQYDHSVLSSSSFEHIFLGETRGNEVIGLHNWYRLKYLEENDQLDYKGFVIKRGDAYGLIKFTWDKKWKNSGSYMFGTSIEFEFALYTLCFLTRPGQQCYFEMDGESLSVLTHKLDVRGRTFIGSAYAQAN